MISRTADLARLEHQLARVPVVLLVGARQTGKTTLARQVAATTAAHVFDLEDPLDLARLDEPMTALRDLAGLIVIDEIQRRPDLFPVIRVLVDRRPNPARFLVLGSAQPAALRQASESLTGRMSVLELGGVQLCDLGEGHLDSLWFRGGFPLAQVASSDELASEWLDDYLRTLVERDLLALDIRLPATTLRRFLSMTAHYTGNLWRSTDPARSLGISEHTVRRYLDLLTDAMLVRQLQPWFANVGKRQVRSPKVYVRDSGLAHRLLGIESRDAMLRHPLSGATWEGLIMDSVVHAMQPPEMYFWRTQNGAELDLYLPRGLNGLGIEIKRVDAPRITPSMRSALEDLHLDRLVVLYPGERRYDLADHVEAVPVSVLADVEEARRALGGA